MRTAILVLFAVFLPAASMAASIDAGREPARSSTASYVRHVSGVGTTKPDGAPLDARLGTNARLERQSRTLDRTIRLAICMGC